MKAFIVTAKARYTVPDADRLRVSWDLVEIQRALPSGEYATIAVVGGRGLEVLSLGRDPSELEGPAGTASDASSGRRPAYEYEPW